MPTPSPPIAGAPYEDVAERTEKLAEAFSGWTPPAPGKMDAGRALIRVFERMARHVIERINRVPEQSFLAFLDRVGVAPANARASRVPLTFSLVGRGEAEPVVPAGTRVGAAPAPGDTREIVFETEIELATTRARLAAAIVRQPDGDRLADRTDAATGRVPALYEAFDGGAAIRHALHLAADDVLGLPAGTEVTVAFTLATQDVPRWQALHSADALPPLTDDPYYKIHVPQPPLVCWTYWNGEAWTPLAITISPAGTGFTFTIPADMEAGEVNGRAARWIRAQLLAWPKAGVPALQGVTMSAALTRSGLVPDAALSGGRPVDLSIDVYPFGERPRLNDMLYIACDDALARPGADVTVHVTPSTNAEKLKAGDKPVLAWEVSTGSGWRNVATTQPSNASPIPNDALRDKSFKVPSDVAPIVVGGKRACWLRIRLSSGSYGKGLQIPVTTDPDQLKATNDGYRPPILAASTLTLAVTDSVSSAAPLCVAEDDLTFLDRTVETPLVPFVRSAEPDPALYLGFDLPFAPRDMLLYLEVAPLSAADAAKDATAGAGPRVLWEYAKGADWAPLAHQDETRGLAMSGLLRFMGPADIACRTELGRRLYWIRARLQLPAGSPGGAMAQPRLGRILTNTVWASDAAVITNEILGSGDGRADQAFSFAARPVLDGQVIEVRETDEAWVPWSEVPDFYASGPEDRHYVMDRAAGRARFGNGQRGMPPPRGARNVRAARYRSGGGADGNRPPDTVAQLKTTVPYVDGVTNHEPSTGGADREREERLKVWGPRVLRHRQRAVTAEDFEDLALEASPLVARARALTPSFDPIMLADTPTVPPDPKPGVPVPGSVVLLLATNAPDMPPTPTVGLLRDVEEYVRARAGAAVALRIAGPAWIEVSADKLTVMASSPVGLEALRDRVARALTAFFHPLTGGPDGTGWDFGVIPQASDVYRFVMSIPGVDRVGALTLGKRPLPPAPDDPAAGRVLIYPGIHTIRVTAPGEA